ncbi:alpha/beta hydrolase [Haloferula sp.]|uniref:alpha/beta hydrolase n=1 Tax=Haloferula sp. TaxID=2497595 RepID=UPI003C768329
MLVSLCLGVAALAADSEVWTRDVAYRQGADLTGYARERCKLDICAPTDAREAPVIVWFHGGGLTQGEKEVPEALRGKGMVVVAPNYRLHPKVKSPVYIEDAAAAVAWVVKHIADYGGSPDKVVVSGHSAGGYLASMVGLDKRLLAKHGVGANRLGGTAPFSGHTITHFTIRKERGMPDEQVVVDEFAPLFHVRKDAPPMLLMTGDRELEMLGRYEENAFFWRMMKVAGHEDVTLHEFGGYGHEMTAPGYVLLVGFVKRVTSR